MLHCYEENVATDTSSNHSLAFTLLPNF